MPSVEEQLEDSQAMCRRLERELHNAIKLIEKLLAEIEAAK